MFGDSLKAMHGKKKARWAVVVSFCLQAVGVAVLVLIPLLDYYELPAAELMTFLVAPPPPPPPPPPPMALVQKVIPREFDAGTLTQPTEIPDQVAIIQEADIPAATIAGVIGGVPGGTVGGQLGGIIGGIISNVPLVAPPPPPVVKKAPPPPPKRIRVGGSVQKARIAKKVQPRYPPLARQARISGVVKLTAIIAKNGMVQELKVISGHPLLVPAALQAVKQWRYKPTLLNNTPVEVVTQIDVIFSLSG